MTGQARLGVKVDEGRAGKGLGGERKLDGESVESEAERKRRESCAGLEERSQSALVGESGVAEHRNEVS